MLSFKTIGYSCTIQNLNNEIAAVITSKFPRHGLQCTHFSNIAFLNPILQQTPSNARETETPIPRSGIKTCGEGDAGSNGERAWDPTCRRKVSEPPTF